jgi:hypothetical protein
MQTDGGRGRAGLGRVILLCCYNKLGSTYFPLVFYGCRRPVGLRRSRRVRTKSRRNAFTLPGAHSRERRRRAPRALGALAVARGASALFLGGPGRPPTETDRRGSLGRQLVGGAGASNTACGERSLGEGGVRNSIASACNALT